MAAETAEIVLRKRRINIRMHGPVLSRPITHHLNYARINLVLFHLSSVGLDHPPAPLRP